MRQGDYFQTFSCFLISFIWDKSKWSSPYFQYVDRPRLGHTKKSNFRLLIQRYAQFQFLREGFRTNFSTTFCVWFSRKCFSCYVLLTDHCLISSSNMCVVIISFLACGVINFEINPSFLIKPPSNMTKNSEQKFKHLQDKKSFLCEIKSSLHHF